MAVRLVYIAESLDGINDSIDTGIDLIMSIVGVNQELRIYCLLNIIRREWVTLPELLERRKIHTEKEVVEKRKA